jgi:hypothetical protein
VRARHPDLFVKLLAEMPPRQLAADRLIKTARSNSGSPRVHIANPQRWAAQWSGQLRVGHSEKFGSLTSRFAESSDYQIQVIAADAGDDLPYMIRFEHDVMKLDGACARGRT